MLMTTHVHPLTAKSALSAPLGFNYPLTPTVSIGTYVSGDARNVAVVSIIYGSLTLWSATLMQTSPDAVIPYDVIAGDVTIKQGGNFHLTVPTSAQMGNVFAKLTIITPTGTVPFQGMVATWPLSS